VVILVETWLHLKTYRGWGAMDWLLSRASVPWRAQV
jgi:hypothetical protein